MIWNSADINIINNENYLKRHASNLDEFNIQTSKAANKFLSSFPNYHTTPLASLKSLSNKLGVEDIFIKDESKRFDLNAFKVCGASFAIGKYIASEIGSDINNINYDDMVSPNIKDKLGDTTFITATDGNHGRAVAWTANKLGQKSIVYMPKGSSTERLNNIKAENSNASILDLTYDDCVRLAQEHADKKGWVVIQDTALDGYEEIPTWIMQGYTNIYYEILNQVENIDFTHVFLQAGVGSFSAAIEAIIVNHCKIHNKEIPKFVIVEPNTSDCIYRTAQKNNGELQIIKEGMDSIMAGLNCGEPSPIAWKILNNYTYRYCSIKDEITKVGMRVLANPVANDTPIVSGESGACTLGTLFSVLNDKELNHLKKSLELNSSSKILCISTEGNTDKASYNSIVNCNQNQ